MRISGVTSTDLFTGSVAHPLQLIRVTLANAGAYAITIAAGTLSATNYNFSLVNGTLTVTQAVLTVTAPGVSYDRS